MDWLKSIDWGGVWAVLRDVPGPAWVVAGLVLWVLAERRAGRRMARTLERANKDLTAQLALSQRRLADVTDRSLNLVRDLTVDEE